MIQEWFKYLLVPEKLATATPIIQKAKSRREDPSTKRNRPFTPSDYTKIQRRFRKWSNEKDLTKAQKAELYICSS